MEPFEKVDERIKVFLENYAKPCESIPNFQHDVITDDHFHVNWDDVDFFVPEDGLLWTKEERIIQEFLKIFAEASRYYDRICDLLE